MTIKKENKENDYENTKKIISDLINEYKYRQNQIIEKMKSYQNELAETENIIKSIKEEKSDISKMLSPNSKDYNIEKYEEKLRNIREKIENLNKEIKETENRIIQLETVLNILNQQKSQIDIGLNILELQEQDRQRIARDLHDSTVQNLTSLIHKCELSTKFVDIDPVRTRLELLTISNTLKSVINEIREIIFNLKPMSLDDLGLIMTIERFINQLMNHHDIEIKLKYNEERNDILPVINLSIFRLIQEACNNAIKHANAKCIEIDIKYDENHINITIKDDGKGFDTNEIKERITQDYTGCGLSIMKERVYLLSGTLDIQSKINKGTIINISVPYSCKGEDR
ncbi:two-component system sensor histidine kinase DegS [Herbinix hemicellulosilytica]|uniref:Oxygen sensor histidine kinase NreB n=1 Tax=Herbinix hemicellulosilytica TaxID=1564487 RepID=A0A0H5SZ78_HERHM|nr:sensor histidine kinase [Herbinix hemicellulosilytica]RBP57352.1 two-component system sensor histidine kinase DegS [Herbinix hemicellulosilytica]CRZ35693.1 hypothetical protein HHT355_2509 [Herbinix hemicellulosilytica]